MASPRSHPTPKPSSCSVWIPSRRTRDSWLIDAARDVASRLTVDRNIDFMPVVAPNGSGVVFASARGTPPNLFQRMLSGSHGQEERLIQSSDNHQPTDWSRDGRFVVFARLDTQMQWDLWELPVSADGQHGDAVPLVTTEFNEHCGQVAPSGQWLAYVSDESGTNEVYVRSHSTSGMARRISTRGGSERDGAAMAKSSSIWLQMEC